MTNELTEIAGRVIVGVRRVCYVLRGDVTSTAGPLELSFADGSTLVLDAGPDGEALAVSTKPWVDPFASPLSSDNERYVGISGKWASFDVSREARYSGLLKMPVDGVEPHLTADGKVVGATIQAGSVVVRVEVGADELHVDLDDR
jgi:hypothetical protein